MILICDDAAVFPHFILYGWNNKEKLDIIDATTNYILCLTTHLSHYINNKNCILFICLKKKKNYFVEKKFKLSNDY